MYTAVHHVMMLCCKCRVSHELQWHIACENQPFQYQLVAVCTGQGAPNHCTDFIVHTSNKCALYDVLLTVFSPQIYQQWGDPTNHTAEVRDGVCVCVCVCVCVFVCEHAYTCSAVSVAVNQ